MQARQCAVTMEHVELWHELAARNFSWTLIFEDDVIFVPFFREKFNCFIHKVLQSDVSTTNYSQQSMLVIGGCFDFHDQAFNSNQADAVPVISVHKKNASRCSHAYSLTSNSARMLVNEIKRHKNSFSGSDIFLRDIFARSATLASVWLDPPLVYQGNQIINLNNVASFINKSY
jgi:GR25 family glycosyltransferase involved in LPS biosynthesis